MNTLLSTLATCVLLALPGVVLRAQVLVLEDGGIEFSDGSAQGAAARPASAPLPESGQSTCYDTSGNPTSCGSGVGFGQEGHLQPGIGWPIPRFTDNGDGTVTDNLTGLIWLAEANCFTPTTFDGALANANGLFDGSCGLTDGSSITDWRLPNMFELFSLFDQDYSPGLPSEVGTGQWSSGDPFTNVQTSYWTSTFNPQNRTFGMTIFFVPPYVSTAPKANLHSVWPVRGPAAGGSAADAVLKLAGGGIEFPDGSVQSTAASAPSRFTVPKTGQVSCFDASGVSISCANTGQDGEYQAGGAWPIPRFTQPDDGTVIDNMTGLVWLESFNCNGVKSWDAALAWAASLYDGSTTSGGLNGDCGLADGSLPGVWRLPTVAEFLSIAYMETSPAIPNTEGTGGWSETDPFTDLVLGDAWWWTSTSCQTAYQNAWLGFPRSQAVINFAKATSAPYVWPVRDRQ